MSVDRESGADDRLTFRMSTEKKRRIKIRAAQLNYDTMTDYLHDLVDEDLDEADLPELV